MTAAAGCKAHGVTQQNSTQPRDHTGSARNAGDQAKSRCEKDAQFERVGLGQRLLAHELLERLPRRVDGRRRLDRVLVCADARGREEER